MPVNAGNGVLNIIVEAATPVAAAIGMFFVYIRFLTKIPKVVQKELDSLKSEIEDSKKLTTDKYQTLENHLKETKESTINEIKIVLKAHKANQQVTPCVLHEPMMKELQAQRDSDKSTSEALQSIQFQLGELTAAVKERYLQ